MRRMTSVMPSLSLCRPQNFPASRRGCSRVLAEAANDLAKGSVGDFQAVVGEALPHFLESLSRRERRFDFRQQQVNEPGFGAGRLGSEFLQREAVTICS